MRASLIVLCIAAMPFGAARAQTDLNDRLSAAFTRVFGEAAVHDYRDVTIDDSAVAEVRRLCGWRYGARVALHVARLNGKVAGYGLVDDVRGKEQPITYALFVNPDLSVKDLEVLYYREAYGGEVQNEAWRAQFAGRRFDPSIRVGDGIANISGATISTNAVTYGVRKLLAVLQVLRERNLLP